MKATVLLAALLLAWPAQAAEVRNDDRPREGNWDFSPQQLWSVDRVEGLTFERPGELRVMADGTSVFRDFGRGVSQVFSPDGRHVCKFASLGDQPGQVPHYLNCFVAGDEIVIGAPAGLHFYTRDGRFNGSVPNNLFERFPVAFLGQRTALLAPGSLGGLPGGTARIVRHDFSSGAESLFGELAIAGSSGGGAGGPVIVIRGLTPTLEAAWDREMRRVYYGCSSDYVVRAAGVDGAVLGSFSLARERAPADAEAKRLHFSSASIPPERQEALLAGLPDRMASFRRLWASAGMVYVLPPVSLERDVASQPVDIFAADGRYLYRAELSLPGGVRFSPDSIELAGGDLYALCRDAQDRWSLRRFAVATPAGEGGR